MSSELLKVKLWRLDELAQILEVQSSYLRRIALECHEGKREEWNGFRFFGVPGKAWFAYKPKGYEIEINPSSLD